MDDRRIEQALRQGPPDEPAYVSRAARSLADDAARLDSGSASPETASSPATFHDRVAGRGVRSRPVARAPRSPAGRLGWVLPLAAVVTVAVVGLAIRNNLPPGATPSPGAPDLLARIVADGVVHIAVSNENPQTQTTGGASSGFDIDVANAVAAQLGVRPDLRFVAPDEILRGDGDWELAFPSHTLPDTLTGARAGPAYYAWPAWLVVETASPVDSIAALSGAAICVVEDTPGAAWLSGTPARDTAFLASPPSGSTIVHQATDEDCLAALGSGAAQAAVTATLLNTDLASRGLRLITGAPVIRQQRALLIREAVALGDPTNLQAAVAAAITDLRSTGQLAELSRRAFGGDDLTGDLP